MWISLAEPFVVPLARSEEGFPIYAHLFVSRLLICAARTAICEGDPVVHAVKSQFSPGEIGPKTHGLARDAAAEEIVAPDDDSALAIAADPVDVEDAGPSS